MDKKYTLVKLRRHENPENGMPPMVCNGRTIIGRPFVVCDEAMAYAEKHGNWEGYKKEIYEEQEEARPKVGACFMVRGNHMFDWLHTSVVRDVYYHNEKEIEETGKDKLVLDSKMNINSIKDFQLEDKDILISTMNSLYLCREFKKD